MLFNSFAFLLFFPIVCTFFFLIPRRFRWLWLLLASCYFYMSFIPWFIVILFATIIIDYSAGLWLGRIQGKGRKWILGLSIFSNIGILFFFKYFNFFESNLQAFAQMLHWNYGAHALSLVLPIGLSFHTFQALSYVIEVYKGRQEPERHFGVYALYVMFFPQLVAGPIERPQNMLPQFHESQSFSYSRAVDGLKLMVHGFFKKIVIADGAALAVNAVFGHVHAYQGLPLIAAAVLFSIQIYCDFSGYTDIARGSARVLGFELMKNFEAPFFSESIGEFWRRWHISLSTWFRDYIYIPLGGNRVSRLKQYRNVFVVFLLSGLWHGADWTFVVWGGLHGFFMASSKFFAPLRKRVNALLQTERCPNVLRIFRQAFTFSLVVFAFIFFRAASLSDGWYVVTHLGAGVIDQLSGSTALLGAFQGIYKGGFIVILCSIALLFVGSRLRPWAYYYTLIFWMLYFGTFGQQQFIYFQF